MPNLFAIRIYSKSDELASFSAEAEITKNINKGAKPIRSGKGNAFIGQIGGDNSLNAVVYAARDIFVEKRIPQNGTTIVFDNPYQQITLNNCNIQLPHNDVIVCCENGNIIHK